MGRHRILPERSRVWIDARSTLHPIHCSADGLEGHVDLQLRADGSVGGATGRISLPVSRLTSGNRIEDRELHKRVDARRFPAIEGVLDSLVPEADDGDALVPRGGERSYRVAGSIRFCGVVQHEEGRMTIGRHADGGLVLTGSGRFDVRRFGLQPPRLLVVKVDPEVDVRVEIRTAGDGG